MGPESATHLSLPGRLQTPMADSRLGSLDLGLHPQSLQNNQDSDNGSESLWGSATPSDHGDPLEIVNPDTDLRNNNGESQIGNPGFDVDQESHPQAMEQPKATGFQPEQQMPIPPGEKDDGGFPANFDEMVLAQLDAADKKERNSTADAEQDSTGEEVDGGFPAHFDEMVLAQLDAADKKEENPTATSPSPNGGVNLPSPTRVQSQNTVDNDASQAPSGTVAPHILGAFVPATSDSVGNGSSSGKPGNGQARSPKLATAAEKENATETRVTNGEISEAQRAMLPDAASVQEREELSPNMSDLINQLKDRPPRVDALLDPPSSNVRRPVKETTTSQETMSLEILDELPRKYHHAWVEKPKFHILKKYVSLHTKADLKRCYSELGLDPSRGVALGSYIRDYLRRPGNSIRVDEELRDEWKLKVLETAHKLLMSGNWALETFSRPAIKTTGCQNVTFPEDSTRILLVLSTLIYKLAKQEELRRKMANKRRDARASPAADTPQPAAPDAAPHVAVPMEQNVVEPDEMRSAKRRRVALQMEAAEKDNRKAEQHLLAQKQKLDDLQKLPDLTLQWAEQIAQRPFLHGKTPETRLHSDLPQVQMSQMQPFVQYFPQQKLSVADQQQFPLQQLNIGLQQQQQQNVLHTKHVPQQQAVQHNQMLLQQPVAQQQTITQAQHVVVPQQMGPQHLGVQQHQMGGQQHMLVPKQMGHWQQMGYQQQIGHQQQMGAQQHQAVQQSQAQQQLMTQQQLMARQPHVDHQQDMISEQQARLQRRMALQRVAAQQMQARAKSIAEYQGHPQQIGHPQLLQQVALPNNLWKQQIGAQQVPAQQVPAQQVPAQQAPAQQVPVQRTPLQQVAQQQQIAPQNIIWPQQIGAQQVPVQQLLPVHEHPLMQQHKPSQQDINELQQILQMSV